MASVRVLVSLGVFALASTVPALAQTPAAPVLQWVTARGPIVEVQWAPPFDFTISHRIEVGSAPGLSDITTVDLPSWQSNYHFYPVPAGTYYFRMRAMRGTLVSAPSNEIAVTVVACPSPPAPPTLEARVFGQDVWLNWGLGANDGCPVNGFQIEAGRLPGAVDVGVFDIPDFNVTQRVFYAVPVGAYYVRARFRLNGVPGVASNDMLLTVACTPPPPIVNPQARVVGNAAQFTWQYSPPTASEFTVFIQAGSAPGLADLGEIAARKDANVGFNAAGPPGTYYTRLRASNACGSTVSTEVPVTLTSACPVPDTPSFMDARLTTGSNLLTAWWQPPAAGGLVMSYEVRVGSSPGRDDLARRVVDGRTVPPPFGYYETFPGINGSRVYVSVTPANTCGSGLEVGGYAASGACPNAPAPPWLDVQVSGRRATVSWAGISELEPTYSSVVEVGTRPWAADVHTSPPLSALYNQPHTYGGELAPGRYHARVRRIHPSCTEPGNASREVTFVIEP